MSEPVNFPTAQDLQAQSQGMAADSIAQQLGVLAIGKTNAEALVAVYQQYAAGLQGIVTNAQAQIAELTGREQVLNGEIARLSALVPPDAQPASPDVLAAEEAATHQTGVQKPLAPAPHADVALAPSEEDLSHEGQPAPASAPAALVDQLKAPPA